MAQFGTTWEDLACFNKLPQDLERFGKNSKIWHDSTAFGNIWKYVPGFGAILGRELLARPGMSRPGVVAAFQVFDFMDWSLRVFSGLLWSSTIWSGAAWCVIINIGILGQTGPGRARKDTTRTKKTTTD